VRLLSAWRGKLQVIASRTREPSSGRITMPVYPEALYSTCCDSADASICCSTKPAYSDISNTICLSQVCN
jgi:hypothetical protein